jgi:pyruvate dehydrogenase E2 component (dihydrolipoamide acetyltransferase)
VDTLTLLSWYKQEGEAVRQGEPLFVVETDKASLDVEAPASGILRQVTARPGDQVEVLSAIAVIDLPGDVLPEGEHVTRRLFVSPRARRLAEQEGIALDAIRPTGPEGAIVERDVRAYLQSGGSVGDRPQREQSGGSVGDQPQREQSGGSVGDRPQRDRPQRDRPQRDRPQREPAISPVARRMAEEASLDWRTLAGSGPRGQITREDVERALKVERESGREGTRETAPTPPLTLSPALAPGEPLEIIPLSGIRAVIAERMAASHSQTAAVTLTAEADATVLVELRRQLAADGVAVSYNDLFLFVLAKALTEHPRLNAWLEEDTIKVWPQIDIGLAVDTDRGLLVPVVRDVGHKGLAQLAAETAVLAARARAGKCTPDELTGSTFTLTNLGMFGVDAFTPIINLPECAILGVGRIKPRPAIVNGQVVERQLVWLSLTFDHRLVDGGPAARFLQRVVQLVEKPHLLMA